MSEKRTYFVRVHTVDGKKFIGKIHDVRELWIEGFEKDYKDNGFHDRRGIILNTSKSFAIDKRMRIEEESIIYFNTKNVVAVEVVEETVVEE